VFIELERLTVYGHSDARLYAVGEDHATKQEVAIPQRDSEADDRLAARLKRLLDIPGISDKDRKLVERNLRRLTEVQEIHRKQTEGPL
jgi:hypothetical protein